jgi:hypothetical protein
VLPITTIGGTPDDEYFGEGLTEELTLALSRLEGLRVVSRTSAVSFRGQSLSLASIAAQLGVEFVVEGSVRRSGDRLRFAAKLIPHPRTRRVGRRHSIARCMTSSPYRTKSRVEWWTRSPARCSSESCAVRCR